MRPHLLSALQVSLGCLRGTQGCPHRSHRSLYQTLAYFPVLSTVLLHALPASTTLSKVLMYETPKHWVSFIPTNWKSHALPLTEPFISVLPWLFTLFCTTKKSQSWAFLPSTPSLTCSFHLSSKPSFPTVRLAKSHFLHFPRHFHM